MCIRDRKSSHRKVPEGRKTAAMWLRSIASMAMSLMASRLRNLVFMEKDAFFEMR